MARNVGRVSGARPMSRRHLLEIGTAMMTRMSTQLAIVVAASSAPACLIDSGSADFPGHGDDSTAASTALERWSVTDADTQELIASGFVATEQPDPGLRRHASAARGIALQNSKATLQDSGYRRFRARWRSCRLSAALIRARHRCLERVVVERLAQAVVALAVKGWSLSAPRPLGFIRRLDVEATVLAVVLPAVARRSAEQTSWATVPGGVHARWHVEGAPANHHECKSDEHELPRCRPTHAKSRALRIPRKSERACRICLAQCQAGARSSVGRHEIRSYGQHPDCLRPIAFEANDHSSRKNRAHHG